MSDLDTFLTRFAAGAGTLFEWDYLEIPGDSTVRMARAWVEREDGSPGGEAMCPLSAQATLETGEMYLTSDFVEAGRRLGLSDVDIDTLASAADYPYVTQLCGVCVVCVVRARLLRICRLKAY